MSMSSYFYAQYAESVRLKWLKKLKEAIDKGDWSRVKQLAKEMEKHYFEE